MLGLHDLRVAAQARDILLFVMPSLLSSWTVPRCAALLPSRPRIRWTCRLLPRLLLRVRQIAVDDGVLIHQVPLYLLESNRDLAASTASTLLLQRQVDRPVALLVDYMKQILAAVRRQQSQAVDRTVDRALVQAGVAILAAMEQVALVTYQYLQDRRIVHSDGDEERGVAMPVWQLHQVGEGRWLFYLVLEDLCELAQHFRELQMPVGDRVNEG